MLRYAAIKVLLFINPNMNKCPNKHPKISKHSRKISQGMEGNMEARDSLEEIMNLLGVLSEPSLLRITWLNCGQKSSGPKYPSHWTKNHPRQSWQFSPPHSNLLETIANHQWEYSHIRYASFDYHIRTPLPPKPLKMECNRMRNQLYHTMRTQIRNARPDCIVWSILRIASNYTARLKGCRCLAKSLPWSQKIEGNDSMESICQYDWQPRMTLDRAWYIVNMWFMPTPIWSGRRLVQVGRSDTCARNPEYDYLIKREILLGRCERAPINDLNEGLERHYSKRGTLLIISIRICYWVCLFPIGRGPAEWNCSFPSKSIPESIIQINCQSMNVLRTFTILILIFDSYIPMNPGHISGPFVLYRPCIVPYTSQTPTSV